MQNKHCEAKRFMLCPAVFKIKRLLAVLSPPFVFSLFSIY